MGKLANIYTTSKYDNDLYNVVDDSTKFISGLPTLIIGWQNVKKLYPEANILDWKINDDVYWTFGKRERRCEYDERLSKFEELAINRLKETICYKFINLLSSDNDTKIALLNEMGNNEPKVALKYGDMLYICRAVGTKVIGISLRDIEYQGKSVETIVNLLNKNKAINYIEVDDCDICNEVINLFKNNVYLAAKIFA